MFRSIMLAGFGCALLASCAPTTLADRCDSEGAFRYDGCLGAGAGDSNSAPARATVATRSTPERPVTRPEPAPADDPGTTGGSASPAGDPGTPGGSAQPAGDGGSAAPTDPAPAPGGGGGSGSGPDVGPTDPGGGSVDEPGGGSDGEQCRPGDRPHGPGKDRPRHEHHGKGKPGKDKPGRDRPGKDKPQAGGPGTNGTAP